MSRAEVGKEKDGSSGGWKATKNRLGHDLETCPKAGRLMIWDGDKRTWARTVEGLDNLYYIGRA